MAEFDRSLAVTQFIDTDFGGWYAQGLPPRLAVSFPQGLELPASIHDFEGQEIPRFENALTETLVAAHEPRNEYHGLLHAQRVTEGTYNAYGALEAAHKVNIPAGFLQPILLGAASHDHGHPGTTFFADADADRLPPDTGPDMAVEWYSSRLVSERVERLGGTLAQQAIAAYIPAASAYGEHEHHGKRLGISRASHPRAISGLIMRAADVVPSAGDYGVGVVEDTAVMYGEKPAYGRQIPHTVEEYCDSREGFLRGYLLPALSNLDEAASAPLTTYLGWQQRVQRRLADNDELRKGGFSLQRAMLQGQLEAKYQLQLELAD